MRIMLDGIRDMLEFAFETGVILSICMVLLTIVLGLPFIALVCVFKLFCVIASMAAVGIQFSWLYPICAYILAWCLILSKYYKEEK